MRGFWVVFTLIYMLVLAPAAWGLLAWKVPPFAKFLASGDGYVRGGILASATILLYAVIFSIASRFIPF